MENIIKFEDCARILLYWSRTCYKVFGLDDAFTLAFEMRNTDLVTEFGFLIG